jgi:hypothetical protein
VQGKGCVRASSAEIHCTGHAATTRGMGLGMYPMWMADLAWMSIILCIFCAALIVLDIAAGQRHKISVMNWVWPLTALYLGPIAVLWHHRSSRRQDSDLEGINKPFWKKVFTAATYGGAACVLGNSAGEWLAFQGGLAIGGSRLAASYVFDFVLAYLAGVASQYFSIAPMRHVRGWSGIQAPIKADTISLIAFEAGVFAFMAFARRGLFPGLQPNDPVYWFMMQIGMVAGFATSYPANWQLLKSGIKKRNVKIARGA